MKWWVIFGGGLLWAAVASVPWTVVTVGEREAGWRLGPNPFREVLRVQGVPGSGPWEVVVTDGAGAVVERVSGFGAAVLELLGGVPAGTYFVRMEGRGVLKVVKGR